LDCRWNPDGQSVTLSQFRGKVVLLNFWKTNCVACDVELAWFNEFQQTYSERDFVVLSVALDKDGWKSVRPYIERKKINHRVMVGNDDILQSYSPSIPTALIIDKSDRIAVTHIGLCTKREYEAAIESNLNEQ
jgi:peroxiredoxin